MSRLTGDLESADGPASSSLRRAMHFRRRSRVISVRPAKSLLRASVCLVVFRNLKESS